MEYWNANLQVKTLKSLNFYKNLNIYYFKTTQNINVYLHYNGVFFS